MAGFRRARVDVLKACLRVDAEEEGGKSEGLMVCCISVRRDE